MGGGEAPCLRLWERRSFKTPHADLVGQWATPGRIPPEGLWGLSTSSDSAPRTERDGTETDKEEYGKADCG